MATIKGNLPVAHMLFSGGKGESGDRGFEEHWLRMLEKAHLESQMPAMQCPKTAESSDRVAGLESDDVRSPAGLPISDKNAVHQGIETRSPSAPDVEKPGKALTDRTISMKAEPGIAPKFITQAQGNAPQLHISADCSSVPQTDRVERVSYALKRMFPPESVLTIIVAEGGVQVVIRDKNLDQETARRLVAKICHLMDSKGQSVSRIVLNGDTIWQHQASNAAGDLAQGEHRIQQMNKLY